MLARFAGSGGGRSLLLNGHVDVVSAEPRGRWTSDPFVPEVRDGRLYGRGACDMKGGVAAMVVAAEALAAEGALPAGDLLVNTVTDEEWNGAGSLAAVAHGVAADAGVVPEATDFEPWIACRGVVNPTVTVPGAPATPRCHSPTGARAVPSTRSRRRWSCSSRSRRLRERWARDASEHPLLKPGELRADEDRRRRVVGQLPGLLRGRRRRHLPAAAGRCRRRLGGRPRARDRGVGRRRRRRDPWLAENPPSFEWGTNLAPAEIEPDHPIVACALGAGATAGRPGTVAALQGWHDAATFTRFGTPTISYGPSGLSNDGETMAHAIDEYVPVDDLVATAQALALITMRWSGGGRDDDGHDGG